MLKIGHRARLINPTKLAELNLRSHEGKTVILTNDYYWPKIGSGWYFDLEGTRIHLWATDECFQLEPWGTERKPTHDMNPGDKAELISMEDLRRVLMPSHLCKIVTLKRKLTDVEKLKQTFLKNYVSQDAWFITIDSSSYSEEYVVPACCLQPRPDKQSTPDATPWYEGPKLKTTTKKEPDSMTMYMVAMKSTPSVRAQEAGELEKIVLPPTAVLSNTEYAAVAQIAAENAELILGVAKDKAMLSVVVKVN